jgi:hypothetical protein
MSNDEYIASSDECVISFSGGFITVDAYPHDVSFLRVVGRDGREKGYWNMDEVKEDPEEVLGAFFGLMKALETESFGNL